LEREKYLKLNKFILLNREKLALAGKKGNILFDLIGRIILPKIQSNADKLYGTKHFISKSYKSFNDQ